MLTARMLLVNCAPSMCASSTRYRFSSMPYTLAHSLGGQQAAGQTTTILVKVLAIKLERE